MHQTNEDKPIEDESSHKSVADRSSPEWRYSSLLERVVEKQVRLKDFGEPKQILLWIGIQLAQFSRRAGHEPRKECRNVLGKESFCNVYPRWWWRKWGDDQVDRCLVTVKAKPEVLAKVVEHADYSERCQQKVEEMKQHHQAHKGGQ